MFAFYCSIWMETRDLNPERTNKELANARAAYRQFSKRAQSHRYHSKKIDEKRFQHSVLQTLKQLRDSQNVLEEEQEEIAYLLNKGSTSEVRDIHFYPFWQKALAYSVIHTNTHAHT